MNIVVKQVDELVATNTGKVVKEFLVYLMDGTKRPLTCEFAYGVAAKNDLVEEMLIEHFIPTDWVNNKDKFDVTSIVIEEPYSKYLELLELRKK